MVTGSNEDLAATASDADRDDDLLMGEPHRLAIRGTIATWPSRLEGRTHGMEEPRSCGALQQLTVTSTGGSRWRPSHRKGGVQIPPSLCLSEGSECRYALWITMLPPAICCGSAWSMSSGWPIRLSKTVWPFRVILMRNLSIPPPPLIWPS
jgi:hypothetical protein